MKLLLTAASMLFSHLLFAQASAFPSFPKSSKTLQEAIPSGYKLFESVSGDLNGDGLPDLALIAESKTVVKELRPDTSTNEGAPRILAIYFRDSASGNFLLKAQNNTFILRDGEGGGMDPNPEYALTVKNKVLDVTIQYLRESAHYKLRYQQNDFYLIGVSRYGGDASDFEGWDINFSTRKGLHTWTGSSGKDKQQWVAIPLKELKKLGDLKMPNRWQVLPDVIF